ncbi:MAG: glycosyltransferase family 2 protein [Actinomycetota bacterium]
MGDNMWNGDRVSVVLMTYRERDSIRSVVDGFEATGVVDEIIVVNNNAEAGTSEAIAGSFAREVHEPKQGYGFATRKGLEVATGDLVVLAEPDGTFDPNDIIKMLAYSDQFDAVFGTRTHRQMIWRDANMGFALRYGNLAVAKLVNLLFPPAALTDVGCTYRLLHRDLLERVLPRLRIGGSQLGPELMITAMLERGRHVEVPVNYRARVGTSSVTGDLGKAIVLGMQMIGLIVSLRIRSLGHRATRKYGPTSRPRQLELSATGEGDVDEVVIDVRAHAPDAAESTRRPPRSAAV